MDKLQAYDKMRLDEERFNLAIDFDGVIHKCSKGFHDGTIYDTPIKGSLEALATLSSQFNIIVHTAKAKPDRPLVNGKTGEELVWEWLKQYNVSQYVDEVTSEKPRALYYIDDKGLRFEDWDNMLKLLLNR